VAGDVALQMIDDEIRHLPRRRSAPLAESLYRKLAGPATVDVCRSSAPHRARQALMSVGVMTLPSSWSW